MDVSIAKLLSQRRGCETLAPLGSDCAALLLPMPPTFAALWTTWLIKLAKKLRSSLPLLYPVEYCHQLANLRTLVRYYCGIYHFLRALPSLPLIRTEILPSLRCPYHHPLPSALNPIAQSKVIDLLIVKQIRRGELLDFPLIIDNHFLL